MADLWARAAMAGPPFRQMPSGATSKASAISMKRARRRVTGGHLVRMQSMHNGARVFPFLRKRAVLFALAGGRDRRRGLGRDVEAEADLTGGGGEDGVMRVDPAQRDAGNDFAADRHESLAS